MQRNGTPPVESTTALWIISGFLGGGKTTVLNALLRSFAPEAVGVLVNDFGTVGVDAALIEAHPGTSVVELNGGQIFCSCVSGNFVNDLVELAATPAATILVESSGMAKPGPMKTILDEAISRTGNALRYAGMVAVVDTPRFRRLEHVVNAVSEQVAYADVVVLNKCDETDAAEIAAVRRRVGEINEKAQIVETVYGKLERTALPAAPLTTGLGTETGIPAAYRGWAGKKPRCTTWIPPDDSTRQDVETAVRRRIAAGALRIKGFVETVDGPVAVNAVPDDVVVTAAQTVPTVSALTIFETEE